MHDKAENRVASVPQYIPSNVNSPSLLGGALQIGSGALANYYNWSDTKPDPDNPGKKIRRLG